ncbi:hypothetical protein [Bacillus wiedmannii]|uniref:hypothetical protein n=1 Tax=Bacillus wiedmannii TaxID=1890302 RepID=UPI00352B3177
MYDKIFLQEDFTDKLLVKGGIVLSLYDQLPDDLLAGFFMEINKNILTGILSEAMYHEVELIQIAAQKRNLSELDLKEIYQQRVEHHLK